MSVFSGDGPWLTAVIFAVLFLVIFRRPLGVNAFNAITLGLLGLPGLGLLFLLRLT